MEPHTVENIVQILGIQQAWECPPVVVVHVQLAPVQVEQKTVEIPQPHTVERIVEFLDLQLIEATQTSESLLVEVGALVHAKTWTTLVGYGTRLGFPEPYGSRCEVRGGRA